MAEPARAESAMAESALAEPVDLERRLADPEVYEDAILRIFAKKRHVACRSRRPTMVSRISIR